MAYVPTQADFDEAMAERAKTQLASGSYQPTQADFDAAMALRNQNNNGILNKIANSSVVKRINDIGGNVAQGLESGAAGVGNLGLDLLQKAGVPTGGYQIPNINNLYNDPTKGNYVDPNDNVANFIGGIAQYAPLAAGGEIGLAKLGMEGIRGLPLLRNILSGAASGYGATNADNDTREQNAVLGGITGAAGSAVMGGSKFLKQLFSKSLDSQANMIGKSYLSNSTSPNILNSPDTMLTKVQNILKNNFDNVTNQGISKFKNLFTNAATKGYTVNDKIPSLKEIQNNDVSGVPLSKTIKLGSSSLNQMDNILKDKNMPLAAKKIILNYKNNPNLSNLHAFQSDLYKSANRLNPKSIMESNAVTKLSDLRDSILNDIHSSFMNNGDLDLSAQYKEAQQFWKNKVVSYQNNPIIKNILNQKPVPNLLNKLGTFEQPNSNKLSSFQMLRDDIQNNPDQAKTLTGAILSKGLKGNGDQYQVTAKGLLDAYRKAPETLKNIVRTVDNGNLENLGNAYRSQNPLLRWVKNNKGKALTVALPMLGVHHYLTPYLESLAGETE